MHRLGRCGPFCPCWKWAPESYHWPLLFEGQEEACTADTAKSAGFTQLGFVIWQTVKYLPYLSVSAAAAMANRMMKYPVKFWQFRRCGNLGSCKGPVGNIATEALCRPAGCPRREVEGTLDS